MVRKFMIAAVSAAVVALSSAAFAQQTGGTADEAKAMLMKAIAAVKADKAKALDMFNKGEGGFRDRDLYVFCANASDGAIVLWAIPTSSKRLAWTYAPVRTSTARRLAQKSTRRSRGRKVKSLRSAMWASKPDPEDTLVGKTTLVARQAMISAAASAIKVERPEPCNLAAGRRRRRTDPVCAARAAQKLKKG